MRHPSPPLAAALPGAALSFLPGCESTKSSGPSPSETQAQSPSPREPEGSTRLVRRGTWLPGVQK